MKSNLLIKFALQALTATYAVEAQEQQTQRYARGGSGNDDDGCIRDFEGLKEAIRLAPAYYPVTEIILCKETAEEASAIEFLYSVGIGGKKFALKLE